MIEIDATQERLIDSFTDYIVEQSNKMDLILKMNYSNYIGWTIKIHKKGYDIPFVDITDTNKGRAFGKAYLEVKKYMEGMK